MKVYILTLQPEIKLQIFNSPPLQSQIFSCTACCIPCRISAIVRQFSQINFRPTSHAITQLPEQLIAACVIRHQGAGRLNGLFIRFQGESKIKYKKSIFVHQNLSKKIIFNLTNLPNICYGNSSICNG